MGEVKEGYRLGERKTYYTEKISEYLDQYPDNFRDFVGDEKIISFGDQLLGRKLSTGYNFATFEQFPINSQDSLIFYSVYVQRRIHLAELLARMENKGVIKEEEVSFGIMATKILGDYEDTEVVVKPIKMNDGSSRKTMQSVEGTIVFHPRSKDQAEQIGVFLFQIGPKIKGGYVDPNIRATATEELIQALVSEDAFKIAQANIFKFRSGNIIALRQKTKFASGGWTAFDTPVNPELYDYLIGYGVKP